MKLVRLHQTVVQTFGIKLENEFGFMLEEAGLGMPVDLTLTLDSDATMTVS